jgi:hypothetical protein
MTKAAKASQVDKFKDAARELGCNESEEAFDAKLRVIAKQKPKEPPVTGKGRPSKSQKSQ